MAAMIGRASMGIRSYYFLNSTIKSAKRFQNRSFIRSLNLSSANYSSRKYSEKHEWVSVTGKTGTIGISNYAQEALGEVVYVQLPEVGTEYERDSEIGVVESVKAVNEIYTPVTGKVTEINELLGEEPSAINESCLDKGWICKMELSDPSEVDRLMDETQYEKYLKSIEK